MTSTDQRTRETGPFVDAGLPGGAGRPSGERADVGQENWAVPGVEPGAKRTAEPAGEPGVEPGVEPPDGPSVAADLAAGLAAESGTETGGGAHPVVVAVLTCLEALESVRTVGLGTLNAREIRLMLLAVAQIAAAAFGLKLRLLAAGETQRVADLTGATSTGAFLAHLTQSRRAEANAQVRLAHDLGRFPLLADALARGLVSPEQLPVCVTALGKLPKDLTAELLTACEQTMIDTAQRLCPRDLKIVGKKLWEVVDPEGAEAKEGQGLEDEERRARARASIRFWDNGDGTTGFRGKLPHLQAQMLQKAIQAFASPRRRASSNIPADPTDQPDTDGAGGADGGAAANGSTPAAGDAPGSPEAPSRGGSEFRDLRDDDSDPSPEERETGRTTPYPVRLGHALMELIERLPRNLLPQYGGAPATLVVTMTLDQLRSGLGSATLDTGGQTSASQARRLACNAGIIPAVLGGKSQPLDLGREQRLFTTAQRIAMDLRDRGGRAGEDVEGSGCVIEGCDRPASVCEGHHLTAWEDGGNTDLADGVLVCPYHHHCIHDPQWRLTHTHGIYRLRRIDR